MRINRAHCTGLSLLLFASALCNLRSTPLHSRGILDLESGIVSSAYNDVRVPNETGTGFSLTDDLTTGAKIFFRARASFTVRGRHTVSLLAAPLRLEGEGDAGRDVSFDGVVFPAGVHLESLYRFDSYRLTYRYEIDNTGRFRYGLGFTAKVRDAAIRLSGGGLQAEETNTGFVPLLHFMFRWNFSRELNLVFDGDALAAPQGRAEDISLALHYGLNKNLAIKLGYRLLEGGVDVDEVYNFTLIQYIIAGSVITF